VIGSLHYQSAIYQIAEGVRQGQPISEMLGQYPEYFPPLVSQMIAIGEKTGRLEDLLRKVAQFYNRELEALVNSLAEIIQPVLIVMIGILIGGLIAAIILPIYQIAQQF
ncbi:MAG: Type II secretion system F domain protein, partial [Parcubacteria group bacterium GW2011_GWF1_45_5]